MRACAGKFADTLFSMRVGLVLGAGGVVGCLVADGIAPEHLAA
jgi:hypothetical protein